MSEDSNRRSTWRLL